MSERKVVGRNVALVLVVLCIVFAILMSLFAVGIIPALNSTDNSDTLEANLLKVGLDWTDLGTGLQVSGYVVNAGDERAYQSKLHVVAKYVNGITAIDTLVELGTGGVVWGLDVVQVYKIIPYQAGENIAMVELTTQWMNTP